MEWVELDPIVVTHIGRLVPPKVTVATDDIIQVLNDEGIEYAIVRGTIRIYGQSLVSALDERVMDNVRWSSKCGQNRVLSFECHARQSPTRQTSAL
ncbi:DUF6678 family protein [Hymenobacter psychrotolerans]|uniref:DUF6678 family protein n=1 Tax=Hymenobacter psychrotolerans TaxID=344998 RepID=UPI0037C03D95